MRAILVKGGGRIEDLYIGEVEKPSPEADEVLVKVKAFGLNRMDIMQRKGGITHLPELVPSWALSFRVGKDVKQWKEGDEVLGLVGGGAYAEYVVAFSTHVWRKSNSLSWTEAAAIPENWLTAFQALTIPELKSGEDVLVHTGASGVGLAANQLARFWNANKVITTASTSEKLNWLINLPNGPTHTINYKTEDFASEVKKITNRRGVDVIVDFPGQSHFVKNIDSLAMDGRMTMLAMLSGNEVSKLNLSPILYKRLRIQGSTLRSRSREYQADLIQRFTSTVGDKLTGEKGEGPLRTYIYAVYAFDEIQTAHRDMESNGTAGKLIVTIP
ncbi:hypothetical protein Clacol_009666 [Clathrus columnatus]|uniref:Enoyl reductase (ER) domain-containing protein n=1 Tax=Clathrus columnatus TaxID=1419009 RepID=A0AAV5ALR6_9AGAM|nr:hypothetical protein Clacol_009666 [Clathrus columnatus]